MTNFTINYRHRTKPTMLRKISLTTKKVKKIYEKIYYKNINFKKKSELTAEKNDTKKGSLTS